MNDEKIKRLQDEYKISEEKLIEIGLIPKKKSLIQGNVTKGEKDNLIEYVNTYNLENENQTDVSKKIREVIELLLYCESFHILDKYISVVKEESIVLDKRVSLVLEVDKKKSLEKLCKVNKIKVSNLVRCCVIYIADSKRGEGERSS